MKQLYLIILLLLLSSTLYAQTQTRTVSGRLLSNTDGSPLAGVNIIIKGTTIGVTTDLDGNYELEVPIGSILVFSFIGLITQQVLVTENNLKAIRRPGNPNLSAKMKRRQERIQSGAFFIEKDSSLNQAGIAILSPDSPTHDQTENFDLNTIRNIIKRGDKYIIKTYSVPSRRKGLGISYTLEMGIDQINKLPELQSRYVQGRPLNGELTWQGADQSEIYSWGPGHDILEFDGSDYPYDVNGRLVTLGNGNGEPSKKYDALGLFRNGFNVSNHIDIRLPGPKFSDVSMSLEVLRNSGLIPNSVYDRVNLSANLERFQFSEGLRFTARTYYNQSDGNLLTRGSNTANIIGGIFRTPSSFDNFNGLSVRDALNDNSSWRLSDGSVRSHAPGSQDNPLGLVEELPDREGQKRFLSSIELSYSELDPFDVIFGVSYEHQSNKVVNGIPQGFSTTPEGRKFKRTESSDILNFRVIPKYRIDLINGYIDLISTYQYNLEERRLDRTDGFGFSEGTLHLPNADSLIVLSDNFQRHRHEIGFRTDLDLYDVLDLTYTQRHYYSSTLDNDRYTNFLPALNLNLKLAEWIDSPFHVFNLYGSASRTIREVPLIYSDWAYNSTLTDLQDYGSYFESQELLFDNSIDPESELKFEAGLKARINRYGINLSYFNNRTSDFQYPVYRNGQFQFENVADIENQGIDVILYVNDVYIGIGGWHPEVIFSTYTSKVNKLKSQEPVALSGFQSVRQVLDEGEIFGAIYGTTYLRNDQNQIVIDSEGFPIEDQELKPIGNPIPDWTIDFNNTFALYNWSLFIQFEYRHGGDVWNGTQAVLDYLGRSKHTSELRNLSNYIFEGVTENGAPNTVPVSFADPALPVESNRWVRYGWDGVGEEYIERASWFRLSEIGLKWTPIDRYGWSKNTIKQLSISFIARNLLLITPYKGVDPTGSLFGYRTGAGIDLFNTPGTRSYSMKFTLNI